MNGWQQIILEVQLMNSVTIKETQPFQNSIYEIEHVGADLDKIRNYITQLETDQSKWYSRMGGTATHVSKVVDSELIPLFDKIDSLAFSIIRSWGVLADLKLNHYWVNLDKTNTYGCSHAHYNCILSGSFYLTIPEGSGNIIFERPDQSEFQYKADEYNVYSYKTYAVEPKEDMIVMFPSFIKHRIDMHNFKPEEKRICISFDYGYK